MMYTFRALEAYDPVVNTWTILPSMPVSRHGLAGAVIGNRLHMVSGDVQSAGTGCKCITTRTTRSNSTAAGISESRAEPARRLQNRGYRWRAFSSASTLAALLPTAWC